MIPRIIILAKVDQNAQFSAIVDVQVKRLGRLAAAHVAIENVAASDRQAATTALPTA